jgi:predicted RNA-binding protein with PUA-like domain
MRDDMKVGDLVLFYHSNADPTGVAGLARVVAKAYPDHTALDPKNDHYDPKSTLEEPIWMMVDVSFAEKFGEVVTLAELKSRPELVGMMVIQRGSRLSVQPVEEKHFKQVVAMARRNSPKEKKKKPTS